MKRLIALCMSLGLLVAALGVAPASAGQQQLLAATFGVELWENDGPGDTWRPGVTFVANFANHSNGLTGGCSDGFPPYNNHWNDCVSRLGVKGVASGTCLVFYQGANYSGNALIIPGPYGTNGWVYLHLSGGFWQDSFSSYKRWNSGDPACG